MIVDLYDLPDLYDALLPMGEDMRGHYLSLARRDAGSVLELACGSGQLTVPLAESGGEVTGLDLSRTMLARARERAASAGVSLALVEGDMRRFELGRRFGLVILCRNSMLHLLTTGDLLAVFGAVRRHLTPDGVFAFDVFNPDPALLARPRGERHPLMAVDDARFGPLSLDVAMDYDKAAQVNHATWYVSTPERRDAWTIPLGVRCIFPQELPLLVERAGFRLLERHGDFGGSAFDGASARQVCVCAPESATH